MSATIKREPSGISRVWPFKPDPAKGFKMVEKRIDPIIKLSPEAKQRLIDSEGDIERAEHSLKIIRELGMDTRELDEKLAWSKTVRATLLKEFT